MLEIIETVLIWTLVVAPFLLLPFNHKVWKVYLADTARPRNKILWVMATNGAIVILGAFGIGFIAAETVLDIPLPEWWLLVFVPMILLLYTIPIRHARTVDSLAETIEESEASGPVTQDQQEDLKFGIERRALEQEHIEEQEELDSR